MIAHRSRRSVWFLTGTAALAVTLVLGRPAGALELITPAEAKLPPGLSGKARGGITRGPGIVVVAPSPDGDVRAPFAMKVKFEPHGGAKIDPSKVKVIYLKRPMVDLTPRLKEAISETGIDLADAVAPPGTHDIKIDVTDDAGHTKSAVLTITIVR